METTLTTIDLEKYIAEKRKKTKIFAHFCSYTPEEIIHAAGILPVRYFGKNTIERANTHLQSYCCSYAKRVLEQGLSTHYDGSVFIHSCDTMQRLSDIWGQNIPEEFHETIVFPIAVEKGLKYLVKEMTRFKSSIEGYTKEISEDNLKESVRIYNENRELLQKLYEKRKEGHIPAVVLDKIMRASMTMAKEEHTELLKEFLEGVELQENPNPRLLVAGSLILDPEVLEIVEEYGSIKYDDLCVGSRYLEKVGEPSLEGIARRYVKMWCPCRSAPPRTDYLVEKLKEYSIDGVILLLQKFCEPHSFEAAHTKNTLKGEYPCLLLELEDQPSLEQIRTRVQAFCEMLEG